MGLPQEIRKSQIQPKLTPKGAGGAGGKNKQTAKAVEERKE